ncbi:MAG: nucleotide exchange factor GrpE [Synergistaceae bacterium]|jgi:molecular chaperone GrpE (heat shock protein)|nr:nucleotide exchange factor GrpE [Synergistaceae bacterium]
MSAKKHDASAARAVVDDKINVKSANIEDEPADARESAEPEMKPDTVGACTESLAEQLDAARREAEEYKNEAARAKADFYNYRTRVERDRAQYRILAAEDAVCSLLPVLDNLERALSSVQERDSPIYKGVSMVQRQFLSALQDLGLKAIEAQGPFNPSLHEAVMVADVEGDDEDGAVLETLHTGYMLGEKVLRAAQVKVGRKKS